MRKANFKQAVWCLVAKQAKLLLTTAELLIPQEVISFSWWCKRQSVAVYCLRKLDESLKVDPVKCHGVRRIAARRPRPLRVKPTEQNTLTKNTAGAFLC